jgi:hypothetical protein
MARDVTVNQAGIDWLRTSDDSPLVDVLNDVADIILGEAVGLAPFSARGSKFAPPGFVKSHLTKSGLTHLDDGSIAVLVGSRTNRHGGAWPYPLAFVTGSTWNRGHRSRRLADKFLRRALDATPRTVWKVS